MPTLRLLPFSTASGPANMARDEALLASAADRGLASLRFYSWAEPTLTLGYFQPAAAREAGPLAGLAWVRRATGGATIVHDPAHELTYALALPAGADWQPAGQSWICDMHYAVREALAGFGVAARAVVCGEEAKLGPTLCFQHQTPGDLTAAGGKVAGSAQRRWKGALLQHGSVALSRSPHTPELPGLRELTGVAVPADALAAAVVRELAARTGWAVQPGGWTAGELALAAELEAAKYGAPEWNAKR